MFLKVKLILIGLLIYLLNQPAEAKLYNILEFGAEANNGKLNTKAIQTAIDLCAQKGGVVYIPAGIYYTGSLVLKSNITIEIENGATLLGSSKATDYPEHKPLFDSYTNRYQTSALLFAENETNIQITGGGTIDCNGGSGDFFMTKEEWKKSENERQRPFGILMRRCTNISITNLTLKNSAFWMQQYLECHNLRFENLNVINHANYNNDGMDINNCKDVIIKGCKIYCSDDAIVIKSTTNSINENILISDCILRTHYNGFKIGTETNGGLKNLVLTNCVIASPGYKNHHGTNDIGFCGIAIQSNDGANIENISITNVIIDSMMTPFFIRLQNRGRKISDHHESKPPGFVRNINISNVLATNMTQLCSSVTGIPGYYLEKISFNNITVIASGGGTFDDINKPVPEMESAYPDVTMFKTMLPSFGFFVRHAKEVVFTNIKIETMQNDERYGFFFDDVHNVFLRHTTFKNKSPNFKKFSFNQSTEVNNDSIE